MAPQRTRKRKSAASNATNTSDIPTTEFPAPPKIVPTKTGSPSGVSKTPIRSPTKQTKPLLTVAQKQALIDNLQLEITERARKLRAQYALQAQGLRTRLEIRVHRIPAALRKTKISELIEKYAQQNDPAKHNALGMVENQQNNDIVDAAVNDQTTIIAASNSRGTKRASAEISSANDKENLPVENPKKRTKTVARTEQEAPTTNADRDVSNRPPSQVLSPKSHNARALPRSPAKPPFIASPAKSYIARPTSPLKTATTAAAKPCDKPKSKPVARATSKQDTTTAPKAGTVRTKRAAAAAATAATAAMVDEDSEKRNSNASDAASSSAGTMIVTKPKTNKAVSGTAASRAKKTEPAKSTKGTVKGKATAPKAKETAAGTTIRSGRTLRARA